MVFAIFLFLQRRTYFGRDIYATGGSYTAARLSGVRTERTLMMVYAVTGACAGLSGAIAVGRVGAATPQVDPGLALQAVAAVLIGGTALTGGAGSVVGTAFGCLFIGILQNGLNMVGVASLLAVRRHRGHSPGVGAGRPSPRPARRIIHVAEESPRVPNPTSGRLVLGGCGHRRRVGGEPAWVSKAFESQQACHSLPWT